MASDFIYLINPEPMGRHIHVCVSIITHQHTGSKDEGVTILHVVFPRSRVSILQRLQLTQSTNPLLVRTY